MRWLGGLEDMKIGGRLSAGFAVVIALLLVLAAVGVSRIGAVLRNTELILHDRYAKVSSAHAVENEVNRQARALRTALIATDIGIVKAELDKVRDADTRIEAALARIQASTHQPAERDVLARLVQQRKAYDQRKAALVEFVAAQSLDEGGVYLVKEMLPVQTAYLAALEAFVQVQAQGMVAFGEQATSTAASARRVMIGLAAVALALSVAIAVGLTLSITRPLAQAVRVARDVASGDLSSRVPARRADEVGQLLLALSRMNDGLGSIVRQVRDSSESIATGSTQIAAGSADLSRRTEGQAASLQQTAASMEQMSAAVKQCAEVSRAAALMAEQASAAALQGGEVVERVVSTMADIAAGSRRISEITTVIDGIAFQTNILALNAGVEAARAGEQGRGFAVVAGEVRSLAQRASTAAREIRQLLGESAEQVDLGSNLVGDAGSRMQQIVTQVKRVAQSIAEIDAATQEQASGIGQVGDAVAQLDQATQQNAALVEESAAAAESLSLQAAKLTALVGTFKLG